MIHNQVEDANKIDINHEERKKEINIKYIRQFLDLIVRESGIPDDNLRKIVMNELIDIQNKRKSEKNEIERANRKKKQRK